MLQVGAQTKKVLRPQNTKGCPCSSLIEYSVAQYATPLEHYFARASSETVSFLRPLARRAASTLRPLAVAILSRKPCLLILFFCEGWKVLFIGVYLYLNIIISCRQRCCFELLFDCCQRYSGRAECKGKTILIDSKIFQLFFALCVAVTQHDLTFIGALEAPHCQM